MDIENFPDEAINEIDQELAIEAGSKEQGSPKEKWSQLTEELDTLVGEDVDD